MRGCVKVCFSLGLILHLELCEECLLKFSLLRTADWLTKFLLLSFAELVEQMLVKVTSVWPLLLVMIVSTIGALVLQMRIVRGTIFVKLARAIVAPVLALTRVVPTLSARSDLLVLKHA